MERPPTAVVAAMDDEHHHDDGNPNMTLEEEVETNTTEMADDPNTNVSLDVTVDVTGATDEQREMYQEMATIFEERFELFIEKNIDYSSSFLTAGQMDSLLDSTNNGPFENSFEANLYKVFTRIQDKDQRFYSQAFGGGDDYVGESVAETAGDAAVYWFMMQWMLEYRGDAE